MKTAYESGKWFLFLVSYPRNYFNLEEFYLAFG